eukprot:1159564-Pelagomonas_calceolata.AAC.11
MAWRFLGELDARHKQLAYRRSGTWKLGVPVHTPSTPSKTSLTSLRYIVKSSGERGQPCLTP